MVTSSRIEVLVFIMRMEPKPFSPNALHRYMLQQGSPQPLTTLYRVLRRFEECGIVGRSWDDSRNSQYWLKAQGGHNSLVLRCPDCGKAVDTEAPELLQHVRRLGIPHDMGSDGEAIEIRMRCAAPCVA